MKNLKKWTKQSRIVIFCFLCVLLLGNISLKTGAEEETAQTTAVSPAQLDPDPELLRQQEQKKNEWTGVPAQINGMKKSAVVHSPFTKSTYCHAKRFSGYHVLHGIDVSQWQGTINWDKVKRSGVSYAIIRVGYRGSDTGAIKADTRYLSYIKGALKAGIRVGVYIYSQATTPAEARAEANYVLTRVKGYNISMPVVLDYEFYTSTSGRLYQAHLTKREATDVCNAFCKTVENAGYSAMVYGNADMLNHHLYAEEIAANYEVWLANFGNNNGKDRGFATPYSGTYAFWQYTSRGKVPGIGGAVDCNFWYKNESATGISITDDSVMVNSNNQAYLYHSLLPAGSRDNITWTSSKPTVAYVKDGYVYGVSAGETTITATTSTGASDSCKITVSENMNNYEITGIDPQCYTGREITPELTVRSRKPEAAEGKTKKEAPVFAGPDDSYAVVKTLSKNVSVSIAAAVKGYYAVRGKNGENVWYGYIPVKLINAKKAYKTLAPQQDYTVKYSASKDTGYALAEAAGVAKSGYNGTVSQIYKINPADMAQVQVEAINDQIYQKAPVTPKITAYYNGEVLKEGKDYTVSYQNNTVVSGKNADGTCRQEAKVVLTGQGNFTGTVTASFGITDAAGMVAEAVPVQSYTGEAICPELVVRTDTGAVLTPGKDYKVEYLNNVQPGTACATITRITQPGGHATVYFSILPADLSGAQVLPQEQFVYQQTQRNSRVQVQAAGRILQEGVDYTCQYTNNYCAGNACVTVTGKGCYTGQAQAFYEIKTADIAKTRIRQLTSQGYKGNAITPLFTLKDEDTVLLRNRDYTVHCRNNKKIGTATLVITGTGNYSGTRNVKFKIVKQSVQRCKVSRIGNRRYNGHRIRPKLTIRNNGHKLKAGRDYKVYYGTNRRIGKATVTIVGKGKYKGKRKISFRIVK